MSKIIAKIIYYLLHYFNCFLKILFKKEILYKIKGLIEDNNYLSKEILNKKICFFVPTELAKWRVDTLFTKEPETLDWINNFNNNDKKLIFWDIGSNIGLYSLYAATKYNNIEIFSFEPSTSNLRILSRNISINNLNKKIKIIQLPLNKRENIFSEMNENQFIEGGALNTFGENFNHEGKKLVSKNKYNIYGTNISFFLKNKILKIPNYIKIDVDGIEHFILNGAENFFKDLTVKSILIELNENFKKQYEDVIQFMSDNNFKLLHKKRAEKFYGENFSKVFNYVFIR